MPRVFDCQGFARDFEAEAPVALKKPGMSTACDCDIWEFVLLSGDVHRCQRGWCAGDIYIAARYISDLGYAGYRGGRQEIYLVLEYELSAVADILYVIVRLECAQENLLWRGGMDKCPGTGLWRAPGQLAIFKRQPTAQNAMLPH